LIDLWYKNAIIYAIEVRTFADGNSDGVGDFRGLTDHLPYLAGLGVTCVWLLPFYPSPECDDGYDIQDYYGVNPRYGSLGEFVDFMHQANEHGIRVIVDLVVNHTSREHPWFQSARSDPASPYRDWYIWSKRKPKDAQSGVVFPGVQKATWSYDRKARAYYFHRFYDFQPDLNLKNPAVREEIERIMGFWLELGVSGFRVDAVPFMIEDKTKKMLPAGPPQYEYLVDFRRFLQWRRGYAMMLAEANVLPKEAPNYFGDGDRMHMLFNFWVNQRLFLAAADEDARPVRKAWCDLPQLPPTVQWAEFLRVHDELDLGRLTPAERDRCYAAFAPDPSMRLYDRGIRRRLASMFGGDRRRIELMNSLLFTLRGTPVIRYGEEIGMGEDLRLPERYAIRTPMQWSPEPNAGFSTAPPERLIRPVIQEGAFSYKRVNVAAQRLDNDSLLNWTARAIRTRKECPEFGWGCMEFLDTDDHAVLAHTCTWRGTTLAALHNFSGAARSVKITWPPGTTGIEPIFGSNIQETPPAAPPAVDLDGYEYRWLRLRGCSNAGADGRSSADF
jgi:maltose alpha-D-glucosyltransferase / alpha-amylase